MINAVYIFCNSFHQNHVCHAQQHWRSCSTTPPFPLLSTCTMKSFHLLFFSWPKSSVLLINHFVVSDGRSPFFSSPWVQDCQHAGKLRFAGWPCWQIVTSWQVTMPADLFCLFFLYCSISADTIISEINIIAISLGTILQGIFSSNFILRCLTIV